MVTWHAHVLEPEVLGQQQVQGALNNRYSSFALYSTAQTVVVELLTRVRHLVRAPVEQDAAMSYKLRV